MENKKLNNKRKIIGTSLMGLTALTFIGGITNNLTQVSASSIIPNGYNSGDSLTGKSGNPIAPSTMVVTRFVATNGYNANIRTSNTTLYNNIVSTVSNQTVLTGNFDSQGLWFHINKGQYSGDWIASSQLQLSPNVRNINGNLAQSSLVSLPIESINSSFSAHTVRFLSKAAGESYKNMDAAFYKQFKKHLTITESYRTISTQNAYFKSLGYPKAAYPGTSNHGLGNAIDFGVAGTSGTNSPFSFGNVYDKWLQTNGSKWGWIRPSYLGQYGSNPEYWHYNFVG